MNFSKCQISEFALFGGPKVFDKPMGTFDVVQPNINGFLDYSRTFFAVEQYSNNGPLLRALENRLAEFHSAKYCVAFCSGFWAMVLTIDALKIAERKQVIIPSLTYGRLADLVAWAGLEPRFCEIDPKTLSISAELVAREITEETALIIGVHPMVGCCDVGGLEYLSSETGIPFLMDSVESAYEETAQGRVGSMADAEIFSIHASKLINGAEGGYVTTSSIKLRDKVRLTRAFGLDGPTNVAEECGTNAKLNEMHAALALANLDSIDNFVAHNRRIYRRYAELIGPVPGLRLVCFDEDYRTSFKSIVIEVLDDWSLTRDLTVKLLNAENISARAYYAPALHQKAMSYPHIRSFLPVTDVLVQRFIVMPSGCMVTEDDVTVSVSLLISIGVHSSALCEKFDKG